MNKTLLIVLGVVATVLASLAGLVLIPDWQATGLGPATVATPDGREVSYPEPLDEYLQAAGREVYRAEGCLYCHSQQVRPEGFGADLERGWGLRRSVPRDYIHDRPPLLGTMRTGPDLANIGIRQPSDDWHHLHLYNPRITSPGSTMPPFRYLYETRSEKPPTGEAYRLPDEFVDRETWIVPTKEARELVAYLKALRQEYDLEQVR
jgi:cytochrome c oxidase cbb3-type subunit 2